MELFFKKVGEERLNELVDLRAEFVKDLHPEYDDLTMEKVKKSSRNYFKELFDKESYSGYLGFNENNDIVCTAGTLIYFLPPLNSDSFRKIGHILNFYVKPEYRKKGYGAKLMDFVKTEAKNDGINRLVLNATDMGYGLYLKSGFTEPKERYMTFDI